MRHKTTSAVRTTTTALVLTALTVFVFPAAARAASPLMELRVEGPDATLDAGTWYVTGNAAFKRGKSSGCKAQRGKERFAGPSALTILGAGQEFAPTLAPVRVRQTDFGPQVCQVGGLKSFGAYPDPSGGFLYSVNYVSGFSSADVAPIADGDSVLWYFARFGGDEVNQDKVLELSGVPPRDSDGQFQVSVVEHDFDGTPIPLAGAQILGADSFIDDGGGLYTVTVGQGKTTLAASNPGDVRSNQLETCVKDPISKCPDAHGRTIVGSDARDRVAGTPGFDLIDTGRGRDRISLRDGGRDRVSCGGGRDTVVIDAGDDDDRIRKNCERVRER